MNTKNNSTNINTIANKHTTHTNVKTIKNIETPQIINKQNNVDLNTQKQPQKNDVFPCLKLIRPHGVKGDFIATTLVENITNYKQYYDKNCNKYDISIKKPTMNNEYIIQIKTINDRTVAQDFLKQNGNILYALKIHRPKLSQDEYYLYDFKNQECFFLKSDKQIEMINQLTNSEQIICTNTDIHEHKKQHSIKIDNAHDSKKNDSHLSTEIHLQNNDNTYEPIQLKNQSAQNLHESSLNLKKFIDENCIKFDETIILKEIYNFGAGDLLQIFINKKEILIPFQDHCCIIYQGVLLFTHFAYKHYIIAIQQ